MEHPQCIWRRRWKVPWSHLGLRACNDDSGLHSDEDDTRSLQICRRQRSRVKGKDVCESRFGAYDRPENNAPIQARVGRFLRLGASRGGHVPGARVFSAYYQGAARICGREVEGCVDKSVAMSPVDVYHHGRYNRLPSCRSQHRTFSSRCHPTKVVQIPLSSSWCSSTLPSDLSITHNDEGQKGARTTESNGEN